MIDLTDTVTVPQAAAIAGVNPETVRTWIWKRKLDAVQVSDARNAQWLIRKGDLDAYLAARRGEG